MGWTAAADTSSCCGRGTVEGLEVEWRWSRVERRYGGDLGGAVVVLKVEWKCWKERQGKIFSFSRFQCYLPVLILFPYKYQWVLIRLFIFMHYSHYSLGYYVCIYTSEHTAIQKGTTSWLWRCCSTQQQQQHHSSISPRKIY